MACWVDRLEFSNEAQRRLFGRLLTHARRGERYDDWVGQQIDPSTGQDWADDRRIPAHMIAALATCACSTHDLHHSGLQARGLHVVGPLDLSAATLLRPLALRQCYFDTDVIFDGAAISAIDLFGSHINGIFKADQLTTAQTRGGLEFSHLTAEAVFLRDASLGGPLLLQGATLTGRGDEAGDVMALAGKGLQVDTISFSPTGHRRFEATGGIWLPNARLGRRLNLSGARIKGLAHEKGYVLAVVADGMSAEGDVICSPDGGYRFEAIGQLRMYHAQISGELDLSGARLSGGASVDGSLVALHADGLRVDHGMWCDYAHGYRFEATGQIRLPHAQIGTVLNLSGAALHAETSSVENATERTAVLARELHVNGDVIAQESDGLPVEMVGVLNLRGARISGNLAFGAPHTDYSLPVGHSHATTPPDLAEQSAEPKIDAPTPATTNPKSGSTTILGEPTMKPLAEGLPDNYGIDLTGASVRELDDINVVWPSRTWLNGFSYGALPETRRGDATSAAIGRRIAWVRRSQDSHSPGPWEQLRKTYQAAGLTSEARGVGIAQQRQGRSRTADRMSSREDGWRHSAHAIRLWSRLLETTVGYGLAPWRVLTWLAVVYLSTLLVFLLAWNAGGIQPIGNSPQPFALPWYTLDVVLPVITLGQESSWLPIPSSFPRPIWGWMVLGWYWITILAGWLLGTIALSSLTGVLRHE